LSPPYPAANLEPYYAGWNHEINRPGGETPPPDSDRDNYFAAPDVRLRSLGGAGRARLRHGAYDVTSTGEPPGWRRTSGRRCATPPAARCSTCTASCCPRATATSSWTSPRPTAAAPRPGGDRRWPRRLGLRDADGRSRAGSPVLRARGDRSLVRGLTPRARYRWTWFDPGEGRWLPRSGCRLAPAARCKPRRFRMAAPEPAGTGPSG